jgi:DNA processing protein
MDEKNYWVGFNLIQGISAAGMRSWPQHFDEVVCDYASGTSSYAANFPPHRRIISGLSLAFVVVQAGGTSGALTAAEFAAEYGREVSADPGSILAPQSKGTNKLIQPGAVPLLSINDLMQALDLNCMREHKAATRVVPADEIEARLMKVPGLQSSHVERIRNQPELPVENIPATLTLMELKGMAPQAGGMMSYVAVCEEQSDFSV